MREGDIVRHIYYGKGKIIKAFGTHMAVYFGEVYGIKTLPSCILEKEANNGLPNKTTVKNCALQMV